MSYDNLSGSTLNSHGKQPQKCSAKATRGQADSIEKKLRRKREKRLEYFLKAKKLGISVIQLRGLLQRELHPFLPKKVRVNVSFRPTRDNFGWN